MSIHLRFSWCQTPSSLCELTLSVLFSPIASGAGSGIALLRQIHISCVFFWIYSYHVLSSTSSCVQPSAYLQVLMERWSIWDGIFKVVHVYVEERRRYDRALGNSSGTRFNWWWYSPKINLLFNWLWYSPKINLLFNWWWYFRKINLFHETEYLKKCIGYNMELNSKTILAQLERSY